VNGGRTWGSTAAERAEAFPCDAEMPAARDAYFRAIDIGAPRATVYRWLCQLRVAPYSYDLIDNFGRRSPRALTPGLDDLQLGDHFMTIFDLADFEPGRHITLLLRRGERLFGPLAVTYRVSDRAEGGSRLVVKLALARRMGGPVPRLELFMMRKQLVTLRELAEGTAAMPSPS
jgi:hypothetical protein